MLFLNRKTLHPKHCKAIFAYYLHFFIKVWGFFNVSDHNMTANLKSFSLSKFHLNDHLFGGIEAEKFEQVMISSGQEPLDKVPCGCNYLNNVNLMMLSFCYFFFFVKITIILTIQCPLTDTTCELTILSSSYKDDCIFLTTKEI